MPESRPVALSATSTDSSGSPTTLTVAERPRPLGLSLPQIAGGALAAVTAAVAASFFGVAGTLTGAALGSVVSSIGAAVYSTSLSRAARAGRVLVVRPAGLDGRDPASVPPPVATDPSVVAAATVAPEDLPGVTAATGGTAEAGAAAAPGGIAGTSGWRRLVAHLRWKPIALVAGLIFVAAMAVVEVSELVIGHPIANSSTPGTTLTNLGGSSGTPATPAPTSTPSSSGSSSSGASPTATPSVTGTPTPSTTGSPGASGSPAPSTESPAPTTAPTPGTGTTGPSTGGTTAPAPTGGAATTR